MGEKKRGKAGQPRKFECGEDMIGLYKEFCGEIVDNGFIDVPTQTSFERWLADKIDGCDRRTIYNTMNRYFPNIKKEFESIRADVVTQGTMMGKYQPSMSIFALKNWCGWSDRQEIQSDGRIEISLAGELGEYSK